MHLSIFLYFDYWQGTDHSASVVKKDSSSCCISIRLVDPVSISSTNPSSLESEKLSPTQDPKGSAVDVHESTIILQQETKILRFQDIALPPDAVNLGGVVDVSFDIDARGFPKNIVVLQSSPVGVFEEWAISMIERGSYQPRIRGGIPLISKMGVRFTIDAGEVQIQSH